MTGPYDPEFFRYMDYASVMRAHPASLKQPAHRPPYPPYPTHSTPLTADRRPADPSSAVCCPPSAADIAACEMDLILLRADDPSARLPASALELLTMESEGWEWNFSTGHYTPAETIAYRPTERGERLAFQTEFFACYDSLENK